MEVSMNLFSKLFRSRDKPRNHLGGLSFLFGQTAAGKVVNERTAMQTTAVYVCVRILAESIAGLSIHVYAYKFLWGNAYAQILRDGRGKVLGDSMCKCLLRSYHTFGVHTHFY